MTYKFTSKQDRIALVIWGIVLVFATMKALFYPHFRSVFDYYFQSGQLWLMKANLYDGGRGFIYFPTFASVMAPLSLLGFHAASGVWECLQVGVFISGLYAFSRYFRPATANGFFLWITLATVPIAFSSIRNTQANIMMLGIVLWTTFFLAKQCWMRVALLLALGIAIKPTFVVFFLLTTAIYRPLWKLVPVITVIIFVSPVLFTSPAYVVSQYMGCFHMLKQAFSVGVDEAGWANVLNVWPQLTGHFLSQELQTGIRIVAALFTLLTCVRLLQKVSLDKVALGLFILAMTYLLAFNPRSENTDYVFAACVYGYVLALSIDAKKVGTAVSMVLLLLGTLFASTLSKLFSPWESWVNPLIVCGFFVVFLLQCWCHAGKDIFVLNFTRQPHKVS